jgi:short-subunit dehydrogenase
VCLLNGSRIITGVGVRSINHIFKDVTTHQPSHTEIKHKGIKYKASIAAAVAFECAANGATVCITSNNEKNLVITKEWINTNIPGSEVECIVIDITNNNNLEKLQGLIPKDKTLYWVQSLGIGGGTVKLKDDNPFISIDEITTELLEYELSTFKSTAIMLKVLLPYFRKQKETRICFISSMNAIRSSIFATAHSAGKGALSRFANAA